MAKIVSFELFAVDLPFRRPFNHSAANRVSSGSIFLKCVTDSGASGFGESLPRKYVTGESRDDAYTVLKEHILPKLIGKEFHSLTEVKVFLDHCDGMPPETWVDTGHSHTAAWCAVDLALLDAFGHEFGETVFGKESRNPDLRYSGVVSSDKGKRFLITLLKYKLFGIKQLKLKVDSTHGLEVMKAARKIFGSEGDIRVDVNMAWEPSRAGGMMRDFSSMGVKSFEQPLPADMTIEAADLIRETGLGIMSDEGINDAASLRELIDKKACTAVNIRISKCGGYIASIKRAREALDAGLDLQVGCQVGESSLLSAAQLTLLRKVENVRYAEGCYGTFLLKDDPVIPELRFGYGGIPPKSPAGSGFGVAVKESAIRHYSSKHAVVS